MDVIHDLFRLSGRLVKLVGSKLNLRPWHLCDLERAASVDLCAVNLTGAAAPQLTFATEGSPRGKFLVKKMSTQKL